MRGRGRRALQEGRKHRGFPGAKFASRSRVCSMGSVPRTLELFYDVLSPYSWLAFEVTPGKQLRPGLGETEAEGGVRKERGDLGLVNFLAVPYEV